MTTVPAASPDRRRSALPSVALAAGALAVALVAVFMPLLVLAHQLSLADAGTPLAIELPLLAVGFVVAWRRPENPVGWILFAAGLAGILSSDTANLAWFVYHRHHPLGPIDPAAVLLSIAGTLAFALIPLAILLFPDGTAASPRWRWVVRANVVVLAGWTVCATAYAVYHLARYGIHRVDSPGGFTVDRALDHPTGWFAVVAGGYDPVLFAFWVLAAASQVARWRRSSGDLRQQLKCLLVGSAICLVAFLILASGTANGGDTLAAEVWSQVPWIMLSALPIGIGVGILRYRLYEIDRLVSRTISYALLTATLGGVFLGGIVLLTDVLPVSSPVAVAASTLAAAALFTPLRTRIQRVIDHRFNRSRYDAGATVAAFAAQLREAIDSESTIDALAKVVATSFEPTHVVIWVPPDV